ncbi:hypothetical protein bpr_II080 (plasmid) [Butyrivibrio proteoclasticus B316]|uniref:Uncharacterized protein n=1 Tax=Butyrivibrio proteoclasticus (strain ATCC 51982 / DSM 14932 / B316) TaxID=515622 RepID=E0S3N8_BUTPB|nr:hypothetical protein [Butyrivibrio proteoclasticus]ADL36020.1 hypothetical protein bpr_II080 [Butyrivibrio proteoclasticus B316]
MDRYMIIKTTIEQCQCDIKSTAEIAAKDSAADMIRAKFVKLAGEEYEKFLKTDQAFGMWDNEDPEDDDSRFRDIKSLKERKRI